MNPRDLEVLTVLRKVNADMGQIALRLMRDMPDGVLPAHKLRELATLFDDLARLLADRAHEIEPTGEPQQLVIEGGAG
jgi:hypothetical protein